MPLPLAPSLAPHPLGPVPRGPAAWCQKSLPPKAFGALAEGLSAGWLGRSGWRVVARNPRLGGVEVDLLAWEGGCLVVVEVKARRGDRQGGPEEAVGAAKLRRLRRAALLWGDRLGAQQLRVDLLAWRWSPQAGWALTHLRGI